MTDEKMLPPGRELDALVAQRVFPDSDKALDIPRYSEQIEAAWLILDKFVLAGSGYALGCLPEKEGRPNRYSAYLSSPYQTAFGVSAPHAICLASLKATPE